MNLLQQFNDVLDDIQGIVNIGGYEYWPSRALEAVDPILYWSEFDRFCENLFEAGQITQEQLDNPLGVAWEPLKS